MEKICCYALLAAGMALITPQSVVADELKPDDVTALLEKHLTISGALEVEAGWSEDFNQSRESTISLGTAEIGLEAQPVDWVTASILLSWDDEEETVKVDEAFVQLAEETVPIRLQAGRFVLPFGVYAANTISDPLTLEAFELHEDTLMVSYLMGGFTTEIYVFDGETNESAGDDATDHFGGRIAFDHDGEFGDFAMSSGYVSSVMDSDSLTESTYLSADNVDGMYVQAMLTLQGVSLSGEYLTALSDYKPAADSNRQPAALHVEAAYAFDPGLPALLALSYSQTEDLAGILPEKRLAVAFGVEWADGLSSTLEYCRDTDYEITEGATGERADMVTIQLACTF